MYRILATLLLVIHVLINQNFYNKICYFLILYNLAPRAYSGPKLWPEATDSLNTPAVQYTVYSIVYTIHRFTRKSIDSKNQEETILYRYFKFKSILLSTNTNQKPSGMR